MKLNKIILSLLLICGFSYGETNWEEYNGNKVAPQEYIVKVDPYNNEGNYYVLYDNFTENIVQCADLDCRPCSIYGNKPCLRGDYACLNGIEPDRIVDKVMRVLSD